MRGPGDVIVDPSALDGAPRSAAAFAIGQVETTAAPESVLTRATTDPSAAMELLRRLAARPRDAERKRLEFAGLTRSGGWGGGCRNSARGSANRPRTGEEVELSALTGPSRELVRRLS